MQIAARHAITGAASQFGLADAALCSDGVSRLVDWYGYAWPAIFTLMRSARPERLITLLREAEPNHPCPADKQHDDATAVYLQLTEAS